MINVFSYFSSLSSLVGIVFFFFDPRVTLICAAISLFNSVIQVFFGSQNGFTTEILEILIGAVISWVFDLTWYHSVALILCIGDFFLMLIGCIVLLIKTKKYR